MSEPRPVRPRLPGPDEIWLWQLRLDRGALEPVALTGAEHRAAAAVASPRARARFVAGRTLLRRRLGRLLGRDPLAVDLVCGPGGKPALRDPVLAFNLSHAGDLVLLAVSRPRRLGVDVEPVRSRRDVHALTEAVLGPADRETVARAVDREGPRGFVRFWTRYEAVVKARGDGLTLPLHDLREASAGLEVRGLRLPAGYVGAIAADGGPWRVVRCA